MAQRLTVNEKLAYIDEVKLNVINAFGGNSEDLDYYLQEVVKKLKHVTKLSEMNSKKNIESTFVSYLAMSLASKIDFHQGPLDVFQALSPPKPGNEEINSAI